jgi:hypothetical protein
MSLDTQIQAATETFVSSILDAIRSADLGEIAEASGGHRWRPEAKATRARASKSPAGKASKASAPAAAGKVTKTGRLARRSAETIAQELDKIVGLLKKNPDGMRSEHIREALGMIAKEMPRLLAEGLKTKKLKAKGQKRATVYSVK